MDSPNQEMVNPGEEWSNYHGWPYLGEECKDFF
jgi:hypothetical protein